MDLGQQRGVIRAEQFAQQGRFVGHPGQMRHPGQGTPAVLAQPGLRRQKQGARGRVVAQDLGQESGHHQPFFTLSQDALAVKRTQNAGQHFGAFVLVVKFHIPRIQGQAFGNGEGVHRAGRQEAERGQQKRRQRRKQRAGGSVHDCHGGVNILEQFYFEIVLTPNTVRRAAKTGPTGGP